MSNYGIDESEICRCGHTKKWHAGPIHAGYCERQIDLEDAGVEMPCPCPRYTWDASNDLNKQRIARKAAERGPR